MHNTVVGITAAAACSLLLAAGTAVGQGGASPLTIKEVMIGVTGPSSDVIFAAQAEPPATDEGWRAVQTAAAQLAESGRLLSRAPLSRAEPDWKDMTEALIREAERVRAVAGKRDRDALVDAGDAVYLTCETCHARFIGGAR